MGFYDLPPKGTRLRRLSGWTKEEWAKLERHVKWHLIQQARRHRKQIQTHPSHKLKKRYTEPRSYTGYTLRWYTVTECRKCGLERAVSVAGIHNYLTHPCKGK